MLHLDRLGWLTLIVFVFLLILLAYRIFVLVMYLTGRWADPCTCRNETF